jgi:hypothetical protein
MKYLNIIFTIVSFFLIGFGAYGFYFIGERWMAALWQYYKFHGYGGDRGISLGQNSFLYFLLSSLFVIFLLEVLFIFKIISNDSLNRLFLYIKLLYVVNTLLLVLLPISGLAYVYHGR